MAQHVNFFGGGGGGGGGGNAKWSKPSASEPKKRTVSHEMYKKCWQCRPDKLVSARPLQPTIQDSIIAYCMSE